MEHDCNLLTKWLNMHQFHQLFCMTDAKILYVAWVVTHYIMMNNE